MPTVVHVAGIARCGTTMLHLMLANAPDAFACGEVQALYRPSHPHHIRPALSDSIWEKLLKAPEDRFHITVSRETGARWVVDASKALIWTIDSQHWAEKNGLRVINIIIWKQPLSLAYSYWKRTQDPMNWYPSFVSNMRYLEIGLPFIAIRYEELILHPALKLAQLCNAIGMEYSAGKENFWEKQHAFVFGSDGVRQQIERGEISIQSETVFSPEFERHIPAIEQHIKHDSVTQVLLHQLEEYDISHHPQDGSGHVAFQTRRFYPLWYYRKRAVGIARGLRLGK